MHFLMSVFSAIGFLCGNAGLKQLLQDSDVFTAGTTQQILAGKDFDRAMYAINLKLVDEVLNGRFLFQFQKWPEGNELPVPDMVCGLLFDLDDAFADKESTTESLITVINKLDASIEWSLVPLLEKYREHGRATSLTFTFWDDFLSKPPR